MEMITDGLFFIQEELRKAFCHHEYICKTAPCVGGPITYYKCRKCGRATYNPPEKLVVNDDK